MWELHVIYNRCNELDVIAQSIKGGGGVSRCHCSALLLNMNGFISMQTLPWDSAQWWRTERRVFFNVMESHGDCSESNLSSRTGEDVSQTRVPKTCEILQEEDKPMFFFCFSFCAEVTNDGKFSESSFRNEKENEKSTQNSKEKKRTSSVKQPKVNIVELCVSKLAVLI